MLRHKNDDAVTIGINLSSGSIEIDGGSAMTWFVPIAASQPKPEDRKAQLIAHLLAYDAVDYTEQSVGELRAELENKRRRNRG